MSTRTTTTTSNNQTLTATPWGPTQEPLQRSIDLINPIIGDTDFFRPSNPSQFEEGFGLLDEASRANNFGRDYFQPLNVSQQYNPLLQGAQYDHAAGANALGQTAANSGQVFDQNRADQWNDWRDTYLGNGENPFLDQAIANAQSDALNQINQQFTGAGRSYNSGAYGNVAADRLGRIATDARMADYARRYDQERAAFENQSQRGQQLGHDAARQLYRHSGENILRGADTLDARERQEIIDRERINQHRATLMLEQGQLRQALDTQLRIDPELRAMAWPIQLLQQPGSAFGTRSGLSGGSQTQPNTGFWPGVAQAGLGLLGGFL